MDYVKIDGRAEANTRAGANDCSEANNCDAANNCSGIDSCSKVNDCAKVNGYIEVGDRAGVADSFNVIDSKKVNGCVGVIDSGFGGISTLSCLINILPNENYIYIADKSYAPYGNKSEDFILRRIDTICGHLRRAGAKAVVIACNTATSCSIEPLRRNNGDMIYVGVEPPLKPACDELTNGKALVLLTQRTAQQQKFLALKEKYNDKIIVSVQPLLASTIESNINNLRAVLPYVNHIYSQHANQNIESVALGCTHYCLIKNQIEHVFNTKVYDSNTGTAIRLYNLLKQSGKINRRGGGVEFVTL